MHRGQGSLLSFGDQAEEQAVTITSQRERKKIQQIRENYNVNVSPGNTSLSTWLCVWLLKQHTTLSFSGVYFTCKQTIEEIRYHVNSQ